jgi:amino acid transporter
MGTASRIAGVSILIAMFLGAYGFLQDGFSGFQFSRSATTWAGWAAGLVLAGVIYVLAEGGFEWATKADRTTDPLGLRLARLLVGCGIVVAVLVLASVVLGLFTS